MQKYLLELVQPISDATLRTVKQFVSFVTVAFMLSFNCKVHLVYFL